MSKFEKKFGKYAISNITRLFIIFTLIGYAFYAFSPKVLDMLVFDMDSILRGQIWRIVTWVFIPLGGASIWTLLFIVCLLSLGSSLEAYFGTYRMNLYFFTGILINIVGAILIYAFTGHSVQLNMYFILFCMYMMLGLFMPDAEVRLYFVLPIKMKWLLILFFAEFGYEIFASIKNAVAYAKQFGLPASLGVMYGLINVSLMIFALINLFIFMFKNKRHVSLKQKRRQRQFQSQFEPAKPRPGSGIGHHKCAICGRTDEDDPSLTFRYCSKCAGNMEYCNEHLFTHEHIVIGRKEE